MAAIPVPDGESVTLPVVMVGLLLFSVRGSRCAARARVERHQRDSVVIVVRGIDDDHCVRCAGVEGRRQQIGAAGCDRAGHISTTLEVEEAWRGEELQSVVLRIGLRHSPHGLRIRAVHCRIDLPYQAERRIADGVVEHLGGYGGSPAIHGVQEIDDRG